MTAKLQSPEKELRFTRSSQATVFWLGSAVLTSIAITMLATALYRDINESIPHPVWALLPLVLAVLLARMAIKLTRHAYLILTPLGIEIFPFFRPAEGMRLVTWQEIQLAEVNAQTTRLTLHHNAEKTAGIHLSLTPIRKDRRCLLAKAVIGRVSPDPSRNG
jgi:multidrug transporter EmrE-like cation transporter